jgi:hypothetical protein
MDLDIVTNSSHILVERDGSIIHQTNAPQELKIVSQPKSDPSGRGEADYAYLSDGGAGSIVYVFDSGATIAHPVGLQRGKTRQNANTA